MIDETVMIKGECWNIILTQSSPSNIHLSNATSNSSSHGITVNRHTTFTFFDPHGNMVSPMLKPLTTIP